MTKGIEVVVEPLIVLPAPVKVCIAAALFVAVNVVALLAKLPPKEYVLLSPLELLAASVQTAPLFRVTSPVKTIGLAVPLVEAKFIVPDIDVVPLTVNPRFIFTVPPLLMISEPIVCGPLAVDVSIAPLFTVTDPVWFIVV